jgi:hypothetical protein
MHVAVRDPYNICEWGEKAQESGGTLQGTLREPQTTS